MIRHIFQALNIVGLQANMETLGQYACLRGVHHKLISNYHIMLRLGVIKYHAIKLINHWW